MRNNLIKYRQWIKSAKKFHYWGYQRNETFIGPINHKNPDVMESQQFTGHLDHNGVEIYEGDITQEIITRYSPINDEYPHWHKIKNKVVKMCETFGDWDAVKGSKCRYGYNDTHVEVVGNIHENPEMITDTLYN